MLSASTRMALQMRTVPWALSALKAGAAKLRSQFQNQAVRFVGINVAPMDASKLAALPVVADVKRTLPELAKALRDAGYKGTQDGYRQRLSELKAQWDSRATEIRTIKEDDGPLSELGVIGL